MIANRKDFTPLLLFLSILWIITPGSNIVLVEGVLRGDEQFADYEGGKFWVFHSAGITIVDPVTCAIDKTITHDIKTNKAFPDKWDDGVYMETTLDIVDEETGEITYRARDDDAGYILVNSGVTKFTKDGSVGEVLLFSTSSLNYEKPLISRIKVGGRPVHGYAIAKRDQFWTHSDETGEFFIIDINSNLTATSGKTVDAKKYVAFNGKLLWDQSEELSNIGFATSVGESHLFIINMVEQKTIGSFQIKDHVKHKTCTGTNSIAYSRKNKHLYIQCTYNNNHPGVPSALEIREAKEQAKRHITNATQVKDTFIYIHGNNHYGENTYSGAGGTIELDVSTPEKPKFIAQHLHVSGSLHETPDENFVVASSKEDNKLHIFRPEDTGEISTLEYSVDVPGHPATPVFMETKKNGIANYIGCMPLTENTNRNHMDDHGELTCDGFQCSDAKTSPEVRNGLCLYDETKMVLKTVSSDDISLLTNKKLPFGEACYDNCQHPRNYQNGVCLCTPNCGSCADDDYDPRYTGVRCVDFKEIFKEETNRASIIRGAGSVLQGKPSLYSPQCGFGETFRPHARGSRYYDASVANFPSNSLQIINMLRQKFHCSADLIGSPSKVVYVPPPKSKRVQPIFDFDDDAEESTLSSPLNVKESFPANQITNQEHGEINNNILSDLTLPRDNSKLEIEEAETDIAAMFFVSGVIVMFVIAAVMIRKKIIQKQEASNVIEFVGTEWRNDGFFDY